MSRLILFPLATIAIGIAVGFVAWMVNPNVIVIPVTVAG